MPRKKSATTRNVAEIVSSSLERAISQVMSQTPGAAALGKQIDALVEQRQAGGPFAARRALDDAIGSLRQAQQAQLGPITDQIAKAIVDTAAQHGIEVTAPGVSAGSGKPGRKRGAKPGPKPGRKTTKKKSRVAPEGAGGPNQQFVLDYLTKHAEARPRVGDVTKAAEEAGMNRTSMPQAIRALQEQGKIKSRLPKGAKRNPVLTLA